MNTSLQRAKIESLLDLVCQKVGGDWLLVGGSLINLTADAGRGTQDIDLVPVAHPGRSEAAVFAELFQTAKGVGLDPESLNSASGFFVRQLAGWDRYLIELKSGPKGKVFRPTLTLFVALKLMRATEIDLNDIATATKAWPSGEFEEGLLQSWATPTMKQTFEAHRKSWNL